MFSYSFSCVFFSFLFFFFKKQVPIYFSCLCGCCNAICLQTSRDVLCTTKLPLTLKQHEGDLHLTIPLRKNLNATMHNAIFMFCVSDFAVTVLRMPFLFFVLKVRLIYKWLA